MGNKRKTDAECYRELENLYYKNGVRFIMAVSHLLSIGVNVASDITDEDIAELEENGLMTQDYVQDLVRLTREIGKIVKDDPVKIIQFCQTKEIFENMQCD